jgi:hypothetical protein
VYVSIVGWQPDARQNDTGACLALLDRIAGFHRSPQWQATQSIIAAELDDHGHGLVFGQQPGASTPPCVVSPTMLEETR